MFLLVWCGVRRYRVLSVASPICVRRLCFVSVARSLVVLASPRDGWNDRLNRRLGRLNQPFSRSSRIELGRLSLVRIVVVSPQFRCYVVSISVQPLPSSYRFVHLYFFRAYWDAFISVRPFNFYWHIDCCNDGLTDTTFRYFGAVACFNIVFVSSIRLLRSSCSLSRLIVVRTTLHSTLRATYVRYCVWHCVRLYVWHCVRHCVWHRVWHCVGQCSVLRWSSCFDILLTHRCDSVSTSYFDTTLTLQWLCWLSSTYRDKPCSAGTFFTFFCVVRASYVRLPCTLFVEQSRYLESLESRVEILGILGRRIIILSVFLSARCGHALIAVDSRRAKQGIYSATTRPEQSNHRIVSVRIVLIILVW